MGKASRWFRGLLGLKKEVSPSANPPKRRWSFVKSKKEKDRPSSTNATEYRRENSNHRNVPEYDNRNLNSNVDPSERAIAVATATAAVAEAAVAAAQAAALVVRLTSSGRADARTSASAAFVAGAGFGIREESAAVVIQSHFRGYLARRALRALKGLVKLQALVRGHIIRKHTADMLRRMQALLRAQTRARAGRSQNSESPNSSSKSSHFHQHGPATPDIFEHTVDSKSSKHDQPLMLKRNSSKSFARAMVDHDKAQNSWNGSWDPRLHDEKTAKILEIDSGKPHHFTTPKRTSSRLHPFQQPSLSADQYSHSFSTSKDSTTHQAVPSPSSFEVQSLTPLQFRQDAAESPFCTANNSPQFYSASSKGGSSRRGPFTPIKSDVSRSCLSGYSDHPNYMACTKSSKAKIRSLSAPKQRPQQLDNFVSGKRNSVYGYCDTRSGTQRVASALHESFANRAYPGSGRLDRLGMPVRGGDNGGYWNRY